MFNVGGGELLVIMLVALVILGPTKLPEAARQVGKIMGEFRKVSSSFQREMRDAMNDPVGKALGAESSTLDPFKNASSSASATPPATPTNKTLPDATAAEPSEVSADEDVASAAEGMIPDEQE